MTRPIFSSFLLNSAHEDAHADVDRSPLPPIALDHVLAAAHEGREPLARAIADAIVERLPDESLDERRSIQLASLVDALGSAISGHSVHLLIVADALDQAAARRFLEQVIKVAATLEGRRQEEAIAKLADVLLPDERSAVRGALAVDNLQIRDRFLATVPSLTSAEVGAQAGHSRINPYATAARWKKAGEIFSVQHRGIEHFPAFQFYEGKPHPAVKKTLAALPGKLSPWQIALWFVSTNGWLDDRAPVDVLDDEAAILSAARHEAEEVMG